MPSLIPGDRITPGSELPCSALTPLVPAVRLPPRGTRADTSCQQGHADKALPVTERQTGNVQGLAEVISKHTSSFMLHMQACTLVKANRGTPASDSPENSALRRTVPFTVLACDAGQSFTSQAQQPACRAANVSGLGEQETVAPLTATSENQEGAFV